MAADDAVQLQSKIFLNQETGEDPKLKGEAGSGADAKFVASAGAQGAVIGIPTGGPRGAMYGAAAGAAIATVGAMLKRGPDLDLPRSTMFEARFDRPLEIPVKSALAQNSPGAAPQAQVAASETGAAEPAAKGRPVLRRPANPPDEPARQESSAASLPPTTDGIDANVSPEPPSQDSAELETTGRPVLKRPAAANTSAEITKPTTGDAPPAAEADAKAAESATGGFKLSGTLVFRRLPDRALGVNRSGRLWRAVRT